MILIVAGVAGSGKTTVGVLVARALNWPFEDGDAFHSPANKAKMHSGIPLTDEDRAPWLRAICDWMDAQIAARRSCVLACSAIKRSYRTELLAGRPSATMVFLEVDRAELEHRLEARAGHFFPEQLLKSQLDALESPAPDERVHTVVPDGGPGQTEAKIIKLLWPHGVGQGSA